MNCSNCQNPIQDGEKFCGKCGGKNTIQEKSRPWFKSVILLGVVLVVVVRLVWFFLTAQNDSQVSSHQSLPVLPAWESLKKISGPTEVEPGVPFEVKIRYTLNLFEIPDLTLKIVTTDGLKIVGGESEWSGSLKKGESKEMAYKMVFVGNGKAERHSLEVSSPSIYNALRKYNESRKSSSRSEEEDQGFTESWIERREAVSPIYDDLHDAFIFNKNFKE